MTEKLDLAGDAFDACFGCGPANSGGLRLAFSREGDTVVCRTRLRRECAGYRDFAHGGIVATLLDEAMGWAMFHLAGTHGVTRRLSVDYRRPVGLDRLLVIRGRVVECNGTTHLLSSTVEDELGRLLASAEGDWVAVRRERAARERRSPACEDGTE